MRLSSNIILGMIFTVVGVAVGLVSNVKQAGPLGDYEVTPSYRNGLGADNLQLRRKDGTGTAILIATPVKVTEAFGEMPNDPNASCSDPLYADASFCR